MSSLRRELEGVIVAYVTGKASLDALQDWLADHVQALSDSQDVEAFELSDYVWRLLDDFSRRRLSGNHVRQALISTVKGDDAPNDAFKVTKVETKTKLQMTPQITSASTSRTRVVWMQADERTHVTPGPGVDTPAKSAVSGKPTFIPV